MHFSLTVVILCFSGHCLEGYTSQRFLDEANQEFYSMNTQYGDPPECSLIL